MVTNKCRAMVLTAPRTMNLQFFDLPQIGAEDGLMKVELVGICGSDPAIFEGKTTRGPRPYPLILGHEIVGRIAAVGEKAQKRWGVAEGDRAVIEYSFGCGKCLSCLSGSYNLCEEGYAYGSTISCQNPPISSVVTVNMCISIPGPWCIKLAKKYLPKWECSSVQSWEMPSAGSGRSAGFLLQILL